METLYRKVSVSEKHPKEDGFYYVFNGLKHSTYYSKLLGFNYCMGQINMSNKITHWLEEIPNPTAQLQADKEELLEALQDIQDELENGDTPKVYKIEELIQKMKQ